MANSAKPKVNIFTGLRFGQLTVGDLVLNVQEHPLFVETPISYLQQGKLRECVCDCGRVRLFAENILAADRLRSCGCRRAQIREQAAKGKLDRMALKAKRQRVNADLQMAQQQLRILQMRPAPRDEKALKEQALLIQHLYASKRNLTRQYKQSKGE